jgi:hypothetical protein
MTGGKSKITICRLTRKIMKYGLVWPSEDEEINPGKCFYLKVAIYSIVALLYFISTIPPPPGGTAILPEYIHYYG